jgi:hypothetical protein
MRILFTLAVILVGCGGTDPSAFSSSSSEGTGGDDEGTGGSTGEGGNTVSSTGDTSTSSSSGVTSSSSQGEGGGCQPSVTCQSVGAECGTILDDGCGQAIECPNNCTGFLTCGGGGDQFKCGCTARTCEDVGADCGLMDDGCGGTIQCGKSCGDDPYVTCGGMGAPTEFEQPGEPAVPNVCNGGCSNSNVGDTLLHCRAGTDDDDYYYKVVCSQSLDTPPAENCMFLDSEAFNPNENAWCCTSPI